LKNRRGGKIDGGKKFTSIPPNMRRRKKNRIHKKRASRRRLSAREMVRTGARKKKIGR